MKVRMRQHISGLRAGQRWPKAGEVLEVDDREGAKLCANGYAEPVAEPPVEKAESRSGKVDCPVDGCDYSGTERGLKIHSRSHE